MDQENDYDLQVVGAAVRRFMGDPAFAPLTSAVALKLIVAGTDKGCAALAAQQPRWGSTAGAGAVPPHSRDFGRDSFSAPFTGAVAGTGKVARRHTGGSEDSDVPPPKAKRTEAEAREALEDLTARMKAAAQASRFKEVRRRAAAHFAPRALRF